MKYREQKDETTADGTYDRYAKFWRSFMHFNLIMLILWVTGVVGGGIWKVSLIWGAILFANTVSRFGWPSEGNWPDWKEAGNCRKRHHRDDEGDDQYDYSEQDMYRRPKRRPTWRKKDLV